MNRWLIFLVFLIVYLPVGAILSQEYIPAPWPLSVVPFWISCALIGWYGLKWAFAGKFL